MNLEFLKKNPLISNDICVERFDFPFRHILIKNLFNVEAYKSLCGLFPRYIARCARPHGAVGTEGLFYKALIYGLRDEDCVGGYEFFVWKGWQDFISSVFNLSLNPYTAYSLHFHEGSPQSPSQSGWAHLDLSVCSMAGSSLNNDRVAIVDGVNYADDTWDEQPWAEKALRSVAMLYYFNNPQGPSCHGGGTSIFAADKSIYKVIPPENNTLFAFEIGTESWHGFAGADYDRCAMVQWFHSSPSYIVSRNLPKFQQMWRKEGRIFEHWKNKNLWTLDQDPEYPKYFSAPLNTVLGAL